MIYENLFDDSMNSSLALMIALFDSTGNLSSPYKIIETNTLDDTLDLRHRLFLCRYSYRYLTFLGAKFLTCMKRKYSQEDIHMI